MRRLSEAAFARARAFPLTQARPLERARFRQRFEGGSSAEVLAELAAFQNGDGGFGHGLEPDFHLPASSPMATSVGLQRMRELGVAADHPLVRGAIAYLRGAFDPSLPGWEPVPPAVDAHPRATWWTHRGRPDGFLADPGAERRGHLLHFRALDGACARSERAHGGIRA